MSTHAVDSKQRQSNINVSAITPSSSPPVCGNVSANDTHKPCHTHEPFAGTQVSVIYVNCQGFHHGNSFPSSKRCCCCHCPFYCQQRPSEVQGDPKRCVPRKISIVTLIKKLFISNYNHTLFSLWKTIHQSFNYCPRCVPNVHHFVASKPVLVWQSC